MNNNETSDNNGPLSKELPSDDYLLAIGKFVAMFSRFEELVATIMALSFGCEPEVIANIAYSLDMNNRCQSLRGILAYRLGSREKSDQGINLKQDKDLVNLNKIFKKVSKAIQKRNILIHSGWHAATSSELAHRLSPKGKQVTGYPGGDMTLVSLSQIEKDTKFVDEVSNELWQFFWDHLGGWILERAKRGDSGIFMVGEN